MTVAGALLVADLRASLLDLRPPRLPAPLLVLGPTVGTLAVSIMAILSPESLPPLLTQATIFDEAGTLMPPRPDAGLVLLTIPSIVLFAIASVGYALLYREVGRRFHAVMSLAFVLVVASQAHVLLRPVLQSGLVTSSLVLRTAFLLTVLLGLTGAWRGLAD